MMTLNSTDTSRGYTIIELMVTVVIVAVLAATVGTLFVKLLTLQEKDRAEAYVRENLVEMCGLYADYLSVATTISNVVTGVAPCFFAKYPQETGGVSLETGRVAHVTQLAAYSKLNEGLYDNQTRTYATLGLNIATGNVGGPPLMREFRGDDTPLLSIKDLRINDNPVSLSYGIVPLNADEENAALWCLQVRADYVVKNDDGNFVYTNASVRRVVRLWNCK